MKASQGILLVVFAAAVLTPDRVAFAEPNCGYDYGCGANPDATVSGNGSGFRTEIVYRNSGEAVSVRPGSSPSGATFEYQIAPACSANSTPGQGGDALCAGAYTCPDPEDIRFFVFYRQLTPEAGTWQRGGEECLAPKPFVNNAALRQTVDSYVNTMGLPASPILFEPPTGGVVNVPAIFHTAGGPISGQTEAFGLTVWVTATPHWHWDFGDGVGFDTDDPGRGYDGTDPRRDPGHYIAHTYRAPGRPTITLTTTWTATYTRSDESGTFTVTQTVQRQSQRPIAVEEYEARLTDVA